MGLSQSSSGIFYQQNRSCRLRRRDGTVSKYLGAQARGGNARKCSTRFTAAFWVENRKRFPQWYCAEYPAMEIFWSGSCFLRKRTLYRRSGWCYALLLRQNRRLRLPISQFYFRNADLEQRIEQTAGASRSVVLLRLRLKARGIINLKCAQNTGHYLYKGGFISKNDRKI